MHIDENATRLLERGMQAQQNSIPFSERCQQCDGRGYIVVGCAYTYSLYDLCFQCLGQGRRIPEFPDGR